MAWDDRQWRTFCALLDHGWPGDLSTEASEAWRAVLLDVDPSAAMGALRAMLKTSKYRPSVAEMLQSLDGDASKPTFDEAWHVLFESPRSPLKKRTTALAVRAAMEHHPLIARFIQVQGRDRLARMEVFDPEGGHWRHRELRTAWEEMEAATEGRDVAELVAGGGARRGQLGQFDPLRRLGPMALDAPALGPGEAAPAEEPDPDQAEGWRQVRAALEPGRAAA